MYFIIANLCTLPRVVKIAKTPDREMAERTGFEPVVR